MTTTGHPIPEIDPQRLAVVRKRYAEEAQKRLRPEGLAQFLPLKNAREERLRSLSEDPWVDHSALNARPSPITLNATYKFFVLGAGFGGLVYAVRLIDSGLATPDEIRLVDAAGGFGGTWYWNRYPGLHCDVESYMYLPLLEETGYVPKQKYAAGAEIREHAERIAEHWGLTNKALFRTDVKSAEWNEKTELWTVNITEHRGPHAAPIDYEIRAQYVYLAAGVLTRPQVPRIPGLSSFKGEMFHTARWNYEVSGGSQSDQRLTGLRNKRVAVIGTAATAIGVIPEIAKYAKELYVFQRTPAYVKPRNQRVTDVEEFKREVAYKKGWQSERQKNWNRHLTNSVIPGTKNLVGDGWTDMPAYSAILGSPSHGVIDASPKNLEQHATNFHTLDLPHMEAIRSRVDELVKDPDTAAKLKPWYPSWCKRPTFSDTYLSLFNSQHVHLVDTNGQGVSSATSKGLVVDDTEYPVDIIVFSTGFQAPNARLGSPAARTGVTIVGRNRLNLDDKWVGNGAATLHGYATSQFPNLFFSGTAQATITGNNIWMLSLIARHIVYIISTSERRIESGKRAIIEVTKEAEETHTREILKRAPYFSAIAGCTPGYFNAYGEAASVTDPDEKKKRARGSTWSEGTLSFLEYTGKWRDDDTLEGLKVTPAKELKSLL
ncbi:FAD/NAD(P)-binding domain-containing protein [Melanomma pulvis-pyrius CBS 109.77]|uniref:FAD/NAD(P)-binding domain-containing protein n=1 Tax=Melanomma pulvis-pyrius CBS 109.77 TaxID=1314802 RepID=A0A6A6WVS9_9PLEO|nr:FAD/NAD(P)-binding domain-containing protein [Melanomma pulvis-pyrius CBS 109.77]